MILRRTSFNYKAMFAANILTYFMLGLTFWAIATGDAPGNAFVTSCVCCELIFALLLETNFISVVRGSRVKNTFTVFFMWMLVTTIIGLLCDVLSWGIGFSSLPFAPIIIDLGFAVSRFAAFPLVILFSTYLISFVDDDPTELKGYAKLVTGLAIDGALLVIFSLITPFDASLPWKLQDHPWVYFFFLCFPISVNIIIILIFRKRLNNHRALTFLMYEGLVVCVIIFDTIVRDITLAYIAVAYALLQIYISVQIEHEKEQEDSIVQQRISIMLSQIQPHFLYNVLTGIRSLCRTDAEKAEEALTNFTIYLRGNLNSIKNSEFVPFLQELDHIKHYVELEKMRYGNALKVKFNISTFGFFVPPLSIEPLVENAISHGVMQRKDGGTVAISTDETDTDFIIKISDDGIGFDVHALEQVSGNHVGLANVRERISIMCGGTVNVQSTPNFGTIVTISLPKLSAAGGHHES